MDNRMTSMRCPLCNRVFMLTAVCRSCVCGWNYDSPKTINDQKGNIVNTPVNNVNHMPPKSITISTSQTIANDAWEVEIDVVTECSKVPKVQDVFVELLAKKKIDMLMKKYPNIEWLAYLLGDKNEPTVVKDLFIPQQQVTTTAVTNIVCPEWNTLPVIGVIHSHHGMGNGFSGTDHEWINQNHDVSLCIAKSGIAGQVRVKTPCGSLKIVPAKVIVRFPKIDYDFKGWMAESTKKIETKRYQTYLNDFGVNQPYNYGAAVNQGHTIVNTEYEDVKKNLNPLSTAEIIQRRINEIEKNQGNIDEEQSLLDALNDLDNEEIITGGRKVPRRVDWSS
jgi:hypothetical protein